MKTLPFLQHDPYWAKEVIWDYKKVSRLATEELGIGPPLAEGVEPTMENDGCQLCCLAMVLQILDGTSSNRSWTPKKLLKRAQEGLYMSTVGLALTPLYADICVDMTDGRVQLCAQEDYVPGSKEFKPQTLKTSYLARAWRSLPRKARGDFVCMLRIGTHDQTSNAHYLLLDPERPGDRNDSNPFVLDPDAPTAERAINWTLTDATDHFRKNREKALAKIKTGEIAAVYVFARWSSGSSRTLLGALGRSLALQR